MILGAAGKALIQSFEKCCLASYPDSGGIATIGWGHTGPGVMLGQTCTQAQADLWFTQDTQFACRGVMQSVDVPMTQNEFDALVSFTFNVGVGNEAHSTLIRLVNKDDFKGAADQFMVWINVKGEPSDGLRTRRAAERALFLKP